MATPEEREKFLEKLHADFLAFLAKKGIIPTIPLKFCTIADEIAKPYLSMGIQGERRVCRKRLDDNITFDFENAAKALIEEMERMKLIQK